MPKPRKQKAEQQAAALLQKHNVVAPPVDPEAIARAEGAEVRYVDAPEDLSGMLTAEGRRFIIGVNASHHPNRRRFTIAHELGHMFLHEGQRTLFVDESTVHFRGTTSTLAIDPLEIEANTFAANLLMPASMLNADVARSRIELHDDVAMRRLASRYGVSVQALTLRLEKLGLMAGFARPGR